MVIPFIRLDRQYKSLKDEFLSATDTVLSHGQVLQGPEIDELEYELSEIFKMSSVVTVASGTDALIFSLRALGLKPGARVGVTSFSFISSASAITHAGGIPIFVDINQYFLSETDQLLDLIVNKKVDGIIAVHLFGQMMELKEVYNEAKNRGIFIIEDAAQCFGAKRNQLTPGKYSDAVCLSFDPTKVIGAYGSGGAVITNNATLGNKVQKLRYHGHIGEKKYLEVGFNSQLATLQAAYMLLKLKHMKVWQERRMEIAKIYNQALEDIEEIETPKTMQGSTHIFHKYVIRVESGRNKFASYLRQKGISTSIHYPIPLHHQPCFSVNKNIQRNLPLVEKTVDEVLSLPIYPELSNKEVNSICDSIQSFFR